MKPKNKAERLLSLNIFLILTLIISLTCIASVNAAWFNNSWSYRKPLTVNNTANAITNYSLYVNVTFNANMSSGTFADLRFADVAGNSLPYWIESSVSNSSAKVWVKLSTLNAASNTTFYEYYGNPAVTSMSNYSQAFLFADDFSTNSSSLYNLSTNFAGAGTQCGFDFNGANPGKLTLTSYGNGVGCGVMPKPQYLSTQQNYTVESNRSFTQTGANGYTMMQCYAQNEPMPQTIWHGYYMYNAAPPGYWGLSDRAMDYVGGQDANLYGNFFYTNLTCLTNGSTTTMKLGWIAGASNWYSINTSTAYTSGSASMAAYTSSGGDGITQWDWFRVRAALPTDPTFSFGNQEIFTSSPINVTIINPSNVTNTSIVNFTYAINVSNSNGWTSNLNDGLFGYWNFKEGSGTTTADATGQQPNGTLNNGVIWTTGNIAGDYAVSFNGTSNQSVFITPITKNVTQTSPISISFWIKHTSNTGPLVTINNPIITNAGDENGFNFVVSDHGGGVYGPRVDHGAYNTKLAITNTQFIYNNWTHYVVIYNGTVGSTTDYNYLIYENGVQISPPSIGWLYTQPGTPSFNVNTISIGNFLGDSSISYKGNFSEVGIWNRTLTTIEVAELYNNGQGITYPNPASPIKNSTIYVYANTSICSSLGGNITIVNGVCIHTFTTNGTFTVSDTIPNATYLIVAGGGGGGGGNSGGGGGGGLIYNISTLTPGTYPVVIGLGGQGGLYAGGGGVGSIGQNSSFNNYEALGGGGGGAYNANSCTTGGSGGGGALNNGAGCSGFAGQGYAGGNAGSAAPYVGAGGGGAGGVGQPGSGIGNYSGGIGLTYLISGASICYAGGGGGGGNSDGGIGLCGGGHGGWGTSSPPEQGYNGTDGRGGGGGGGGSTGGGVGGNGGSGVVIISYPAIYLINQTTTTSFSDSFNTIVSIPISLISGAYNWFVDAFDFAGNSVISPSKGLTVDTTVPQIQFVPPTLSDGANASQNFITANVSVNVTNEKNIIFTLYQKSPNLFIPTSYSCTGVFDANGACINAFDGNWSTSAFQATPGTICASQTGFIYLNYTFNMPNQWINWTTKLTGGGVNMDYSLAYYYNDGWQPCGSFNFISSGNFSCNINSNSSINQLRVSLLTLNDNGHCIGSGDGSIYQVYESTFNISSSPWVVNSSINLGPNNRTYNWTNLPNGPYLYNVQDCNQVNCNSTENRGITLDTITPNVTLISPITPICGDVAVSGATLNIINNTCIYTFRNSGTFNPSSSITAKVLVVAGGGSGGIRIGGGGGAGGLIYNASYTISNGTYNVVVGTGGAPVTSLSGQGVAGNNGANSSFGIIQSAGGGGGGAYSSASPTIGGSGGGGWGNNGGGTGANGILNQGNKGGNGYTDSYAGGGGGAGAVGGNGVPSAGGNGGIGLSYDINGTAVYYAGGGGGSADVGAGIGGLGGGGNGTLGIINGVNATPNTGGGGGGSRNNDDAAGRTSGAGGSGIVIISYPIQYNLSTTYVNNNTVNFTYTINESLIGTGIKNSTIYVYNSIWPSNLNNGLLSYWNLDNTQDIAGSKNLTAVGSPQLTSGCKIGSCYYFDGSSYLINATGVNSLGYPTGSDISTLSMWIKGNSQSGYPMLFTYGPATPLSDRRLYVAGGTSLNGVTTSGGGILMYNTPSTFNGNWHNVVLINTGGVNQQLWIDGINVVNGTDWNGNTIIGKISIAGTAGDDKFVGYIDEVGIWNRTLIPSEIAQLYNNGNGTTYGPNYINQTTTTSFSNLFNTIVGVPITLVDGVYSWFADVFDFAGNRGISATQNLTIDTNPVKIEFVSPTLPTGTNASQTFITAAVNVTSTNQKNITYYLRSNGTTFNGNFLTWPSNLNTGLLGYWNFDQSGSSSSLTDSLGNFNGSLIGGSPSWVAGKLGNAFDFSGSNYFNLNSPFTSGNFTILCWEKTTSTNTCMFGMGAYPAGNNGIFDCQVGGGGTLFEFGSMGVIGTDTVTNVNDGAWHLIGGTHTQTNPDKWQNYIDGSANGPLGNGGNINLAPQNMYFGKDMSGSGGNKWVGLIDECALWNRTLNATEMTQVYNNGNGITYNTGAAPLSYTWTNLTNGLYTYSVQDCNLAGTCNSTETRTIMLDTIAPNVTIINPITANTYNCSGVSGVSGANFTVVNGNCIYTFNSNGTFNVSSSLTAQVLVVAGGGGGTHGGGGAGGYLYNTSKSITSGSYSVTVGLGGNPGMVGLSGADPIGTNGGNSVFNDMIAIGGGYGGDTCNSGHYPTAGGSGGGQGGCFAVKAAGAAGTPGQGFLGGYNDGGTSAPYASGGGGGASIMGGNASDASHSGGGGNGILVNINGIPTYYAGGGGGGDYQGGGGWGVGGLGGGANGSDTTGNNGTNGLGGGGGGAQQTYYGGYGGSGVVIISFPAQLISYANATTYVTNSTNNFTYAINEIGAATSYWSSSALGNGLLGYWNGSSVKDATGKQPDAFNQGIFANGGITNNGIISFDGITHESFYVTPLTQNFTQTTPVSISFWTNQNTHLGGIFAGVNNNITTWTTDWNGFNLYAEDLGTGDGFHPEIDLGQYVYATNLKKAFTLQNLTYNNWTHYVIIYNGTVGSGSDYNFQVYENGILISPPWYQGGNPPTGSGTVNYNVNSFSLGNFFGAVSGFANIGNYSEIGLWNRTLNATEVTELYNNGTGLTYGQGQSSGATGSGIKNSTIYIYNQTLGCLGTGGNITIVGGKCIHTFLANGSFTIPNNVNASILVVAGGGSGGGNSGTGNGGGGGAGGLIYNASYTISNGTYTVTIGLGGAGETITYGNNGGNSTFNGLINATGGGGGGYYPNLAGLNGGSGGGGGQTTGAGGLGIVGQGNNGDVGNVVGGGGGGSGTLPAAYIPSCIFMGQGGNGTIINITGTPTYYAGGGGGGSAGCSDIMPGGLGGGGNGSTATGVITGTPGINGTGGGGGGGNGPDPYRGSAGGSGIVIISYPTSIVSGGLVNKTTTTSFSNLFNTIVSIPITLVDGVYSWFTDAFDFSSNRGVSNTYNLTVDTVPPQIGFIPPTLTNGANASQTYVTATVDVNETSESNITFYLENTPTTFTNATRTYTWTNLSNGIHNYHVVDCSFTGECTSTEIRTIMLDTINPSIAVISPNTNVYLNNSNINFTLSVGDSGAASSYWTSNLNTNLLASYNFNEGSGTKVIDLYTGIKNMTSYQGSINWNTTTSISGDSLHLDASHQVYNNSYLFTETTPFTFSFWFYRNNDVGQTQFIGSYPSGSVFGAFTGITLYDQATAGPVRRSFSTYLCSDNTGPSNWGPLNCIQKLTTYALPTGQWVHVVTTYNGSKTMAGVHTYFNGAEASYDLTNSIDGLKGTFSKTGIILGGGDTGNTYHDDYLIDDLSVWNRTLNSTEVTQLYNNGNGLYYNSNLSVTNTTGSGVKNATVYIYSGTRNLNTFNNTLSAENITFSAPGQTITRYLTIAKNTTVTSAYLSISGMIGFNGTYVQQGGSAGIFSQAAFGGNDRLWIFTYTKPAGYLNNGVNRALWQVKHGNQTVPYNITIPDSCDVVSPFKVGIDLNGATYTSQPYCNIGGSSWQPIGTTITTAGYNNVQIDSDPSKAYDGSYTTYVGWAPSAYAQYYINSVGNPSGNNMYEQNIFWPMGSYANGIFNLSVGNTQVWNYTGLFNITNNQTSNLVNYINNYLSTCTYVDGYCDVPLNFYSNTTATLQYSGVQITYSNFQQSASTSSFSNIFNAIVGIPVTLVDGAYNWFADVFDFAGNKNTTNVQNFTIDTVPPQIGFIPPTLPTGTNASQTFITAAVNVNETNEANITYILNGVSTTFPSITPLTEAHNIAYNTTGGPADGITFCNVLKATYPISISSFHLNATTNTATICSVRVDGDGAYSNTQGTLVGTYSVNSSRWCNVNPPVQVNAGQYFDLCWVASGQWNYVSVNPPNVTGTNVIWQNTGFYLGGPNYYPMIDDVDKVTTTVTGYPRSYTWNSLLNGLYNYLVTECSLTGDCVSTETRTIFLDTVAPNITAINPPLNSSPYLNQSTNNFTWVINESETTSCGSGGSSTIVNGYCIVTFNSSGVLTLPSSANAEVLVVAGGGGGGSWYGGGGGAGGLIYNTSYPISGNVSITVGTGGAGGISQNGGANGTNSVFGSLIAIGGGGGSGENNYPQIGGSGGGGGPATGHGPPANGTIGQGNRGGYMITDGQLGGGGGGGASTIGGNMSVALQGGVGGNGTLINITGTNTYYAGGGGGGGRNSQVDGGIGGLGGGGNGTRDAYIGNNGINGTGGGGGGGSDGGVGNGGNGGSGIIIVKYPAMTTGTGIKNSTLYIYNTTGWATDSLNSAWYKRTTLNLNNYPNQINLTYLSGINGDFSDLRFYSGDCHTAYQPLQYRISSSTNSVSAIVWIANAPASKQVCMYYNNPLVSAGQNASLVVGNASLTNYTLGGIETTPGPSIADTLVNKTIFTSFTDMFNTLISLPVTLADGTYKWFANVFDFAGNENNTPNVTISVDTLTPGINFVSPTNPSGTKTNAGLPVNVSVIEMNPTNLSIYLYNNTNWLCYQETANASTITDGNCMQNYSGTYTCVSGYCTWNNYPVIYDGDWATSSYGTPTEARMIVNYTKPMLSTGAQLQFKTGVNYSNVSIPPACWNADSKKVSILVASDTNGIYKTYINCWNGVDYTTNQLYFAQDLSNASYGDFYEEAILWNISTLMNTTTNYNNNNLYVNYSTLINGIYYYWADTYDYTGRYNSTSLRNGTVDIPPNVTWLNQNPPGITTNNSDAGVFINYSVTATGGSLNQSSIGLTFTTNKNSTYPYFIYINGTGYGGWTTYPPYSNPSPNIYTWRLDDNDIYPGTYNLDSDTMESTPHSAWVLTNSTTWANIGLLNISYKDSFNQLEIMMNATSNASGTSQVYYCNSTYTTGDPSLNNNCALLETVDPSTPYDHCDSNISCQIIIPMVIVPFDINTGLVNNQTVATSISQFLVSGGLNGSWNVYYINIASRTGAAQTSNDNAASWTNQPMTFDAHMHQYDGNDTLMYYVNASTIFGGTTKSAIKSYLIVQGVLPPTSPNINTPTPGYYSQNMYISYDPSYSPNGYQLLYYNISLRNPDQTYNRTIIANNSLNLSYNWNTTNAPDGNYLVRVRVYDNASQSNYGESELFTVDNTFPLASYNSGTTPDNSYINTSMTYNISASDTYLSNMTVTLYFNSNPVYTNSTNLSGNTSALVTGGFPFPMNGVYTFNAVVCDYAGNCNTTATRTVTYDTVYPQITYSSGTAPDYSNLSQSNIFVNVSVIENNTANITFYLNNLTGGNIYTNTFSMINQSSNSSINWTGLPDGFYNYSVTVIDKAGQQNSTSVRNILLDTQNPNAVLISPTNNTYTTYLTNNFTTSITDNLGIKTATLNIFNQGNTLVSSSTTSYAPNTLSAVLGIPITLTDNVYHWFYQVFDWAGNVFNTQNNTLTIDTVPPVLVFAPPTTPASGPVYSITWITVNASATDTNLLLISTNLTLVIGGAPFTDSYTLTPTATPQDSLFHNWTGLSQGIYNLSAYAIDKAGNNVTISELINIDTEPPTINYTYPTPNSSLYTPKQSFIVNVSADDPNFVDQTIYYWYENGAVQTQTTASKINTLNQTNLADGAYYFNASARDLSGRVAWLPTRNVTVEYRNQNVSACKELFVEGGNYNILVDLVSANSNTVCLNVTAQDVTINCLGHSVTGNAAILITKTGAELKNCVVNTNNANGTALAVIGNSPASIYVHDSSFEDSKYGIYVAPEASITAKSINIFNNDYGIYLNNSNNGNTFNYISFTGNHEDSMTFLNSSSNIITNMGVTTAEDLSGNGVFHFVSSDDNLFTTCNITELSSKIWGLYNYSVNNSLYSCFYPLGTLQESTDQTSQLLVWYPFTASVVDKVKNKLNNAIVSFIGNVSINKIVQYAPWKNQANITYGNISGMMYTNDLGTSSTEIMQYMNIFGNMSTPNPYNFAATLKPFTPATASIITGSYGNGTYYQFVLSQEVASSSLSRVAMWIILGILFLIGIAASIGFFMVRMREGYSVVDIWKYFIILVIWLTIFTIIYFVLAWFIMGSFYPQV